VPTYEYKCPEGHSYSEKRGMHDEAGRDTCPECDKPLSRVFAAPPIQFNGTGWGSSGGKLR
jgi:putative FmdB family regulatory protein